MVFHILLVAITRSNSILIALHDFCHLGPGVEFEYLTEREGWFDNIAHRIQYSRINLVDLRHGERQVVVVVTDIHHVDYGIFVPRCFYVRCLGRRIQFGTIRLGRIEEDGVTTHSKDFIAFGVVARVFPYRITNDAIREVMFTYVARFGNPYGIGDIGITYGVSLLVNTFAIPAPPAIEAALTHR